MRELEETKAELDTIDTYSDGQRLAVELHEMNCRQNHTDGCGWHYEIHSKDPWAPNSEHMRWYRKATDAMAIANYDTVLQIANAIK